MDVRTPNTQLVDVLATQLIQLNSVSLILSWCLFFVHVLKCCTTKTIPYILCRKIMPVKFATQTNIMI